MDTRLRPRGSVLIVSIGMLTMLAVLALIFANMVQVERKISSNYVDLVRAKLYAQSGIERGALNLSNMFAMGSDGVDNDGDGNIDESDEQMISIAEDVGKVWLYGLRTIPPLYDPAIPLERARYVSCQQLSGGVPVTASVDLGANSLQPGAIAGGVDSGTTLFGVSQDLVPTYQGGRDYYALKVIDTQSMLYINGPDTNDAHTNLATAATVAALTPQRIAILNNLGARPAVNVPNLGTRISAGRLNLGRNFGVREELKSFPTVPNATIPLSVDEYNRVALFISTWAWIDQSTLCPLALTHPREHDPNIVHNSAYQVASGPDDMTGSDECARADDGPRWSRSPLAVDEDAKFSCHTDRMTTSGHYDWVNAVSPTNAGNPPSAWPVWLREPRAPVNINTAAYELLAALCTGIRGRYMTWLPNPLHYTGDGWRPSESVQISITEADALATQIINRRASLVSTRGYGFATWYDFEQFMDTVVTTTSTAATPITSSSVLTGSSDQIRAKRDLIKANFNPNSKLAAFNPDRARGQRYGDTDKASMGFFMADGQTGNWTTEFCFSSCGYFEIQSMGRVLGPVNPGTGRYSLIAEKKISTYLKVYDVFKHSTQKEFRLNRVSGTGGPGVNYFPESESDIPQPDQNSAEYDGFLTAATTDANNAGGLNCWQAHYTSDFRFYSGNQPSQQPRGTAEEGVSVINRGGTAIVAGAQSELFPDGYFSHETRRYPTYNSSQTLYGAPSLGSTDEYVRVPATGIVNMTTGTIDMWVKPTWRATEFRTSGDNATIAAAGRTFFTFGYGGRGTFPGYGCLTNSQAISENRITIFCRPRSGQVRLYATHGTRGTG